MLAIELIYVMDGLCDADSDDGWVTWVGEELVILLGSAILVATIVVVMGIVMGKTTRSGECYDVGTRRWTMTIYYLLLNDR